MIDNVSTEL